MIDSIKESDKKKKKKEFVLDTQALLKQKAFDAFIVDGLTHEVFFTLTSNNKILEEITVVIINYHLVYLKQFPWPN